MTDKNKPLNYRTLSELYAAYNAGVAFEVTDSEGTYPETYPVTGMSLTEDAAGLYVFAKTSTFPHVPWSVFLPDGSLEDHSFLHLRHSPEPATERYFTVVYKLTDANVAKYLSNRDWVTYVYADSMAELANLKELSAEPAAPAQPVAAPAGWVLVQVEPTSKQVVMMAGEILHQQHGTADSRHPGWNQAVEQAESAYRAMLAAAPQPAAQAAPVDAASRPLTDSQIADIYFEALGQHLREQDRKTVTRFARAIEAAQEGDAA